MNEANPHQANIADRVAVIGECMLELRRDQNVVKSSPSFALAPLSFGGDTLNFSIYLARLGVPVDYVTALGDDSLSDWMINAWRREGVGCDQVRREPNGVPGMYMIETDDLGERSFLYWRDNTPARRLFDNPKEAENLFARLSTYKYVYLSGITLSLYSAPTRDRLFEFLRTYSKSGGIVIFDDNYRPSQWPNREAALESYETMYRLTRIALPTMEDEQLLFGDVGEEAIFSRLKTWNVDEIVLKKGARGCTIVTDSGSHHLDAQKVDQVIDTTSAGDSFNAGYIAARIAGKSCFDAAQLGHLLASRVVQHSGAIIPEEAMMGISN